MTAQPGRGHLKCWCGAKGNDVFELDRWLRHFADRHQDAARDLAEKIIAAGRPAIAAEIVEFARIAESNGARDLATILRFAEKITSPTTSGRDVDAAVRFHLDRAAQHDVTAARIRAEGGDPTWDVDRADDNRRQAYVLRQEATHGMRCCSRCLRLGHTRLGDRECDAPWAPVPRGYPAAT